MNSSCEAVAMMKSTSSLPPRAGTKPDERDELVIDHLGLVKVIAARMRGSLPGFVDFDDLVQAGTLGLMDAARKFSPEKQIAFSVYAKHRIRGAILDSL